MKKLTTIFLLLLCGICNGQNLIPQDNSEQEYLKTRNSYIKYFSSKAWDDASFKQEKDSLKELEKKLREIMKDSPFNNKTEKINLETLFEGIGFGNLDGLIFNKDSLTFFYTTKNLFMEYFRERRLNKYNALTSEEVENIFQSAFYSDAKLTNFTFIKIPSAENVQAYGMVGVVAQEISDIIPRVLLVFVSKGRFIYMVEKNIEIQITQIPECKSVWDSSSLASQKKLETYRQSNLNDTLAFKKVIDIEQSGWDKYCDCYRKKLRNTAQFGTIQKQIDNLFYYIVQ